MTSPYRFHQFWLNADDADVGNFLRWYTDFQQSEIEEIEAKHAEAPHERLAQRQLADAVTDLVHGVEERQAAEAAASALFGRGELSDLTASQIEALAQEVPEVLWTQTSPVSLPPKVLIWSICCPPPHSRKAAVKHGSSWATGRFLAMASNWAKMIG